MITKKEIALGLLQALKKGLAQHLNTWVEGEKEEGRQALATKGMSPKKRQESLDWLKSKVPVKTTTDVNGSPQRHYLLHRTFGDEEGKSNVISSIERKYYDNAGKVRVLGKQRFTPFTSWSTQPLLAAVSSTRHVASAWIPESHITFVPKIYSKIKGLSPTTKEWANDEDELIVKPGLFPILHHSKISGEKGDSTWDLVSRHKGMYRDALLKQSKEPDSGIALPK